MGLVGSNGAIGRDNVQSGYIDALVNSQIIVTANPNDWEGDSRLGEALASGAVVLVDRMVDPPAQYVNGRELYYYDSLPHLFKLLEHVISSPKKADAMADAGRQAARTFPGLAEEMVRTVLDQSALEPPVRLFLELPGHPGSRADGFTLDGLRSLRSSLAFFVDEYDNADVIILPLWTIFLRQLRHGKSFATVINKATTNASASSKLILAYDWHDEPQLLPAAELSDSKRVHFYFKRSRVVKRKGRSHGLFNYTRPVFPMHYAVFSDKLSMINARIDSLRPRSQRPTNLSCFFSAGPDTG